jgi:hypothetical protein
LDEFETQTSQTSSQFFPIPSKPCILGITEQALIGNRREYLLRVHVLARIPRKPRYKLSLKPGGFYPRAAAPANPAPLHRLRRRATRTGTQYGRLRRISGHGVQDTPLLPRRPPSLPRACTLNSSPSSSSPSPPSPSRLHGPFGCTERRLLHRSDHRAGGNTDFCIGFPRSWMTSLAPSVWMCCCCHQLP